MLFDGNAPDTNGQNKAIRKLLKGTTREVNLVLRQLRQRIMDATEVIGMSTIEYFMILCSAADFAEDEERVKVANIFGSFVDGNREPIPNVVRALNEINSQNSRFIRRYSHYWLGSTCLTCESMFREYSRKRGLSKLYRDIGKSSFYYSGHSDLSENFDNWTNFISQNVFN